MPTNNSPLEYLAAFAIVYAVGVLSTLCLTKYIAALKRAAHRARSSSLA